MALVAVSSRPITSRRTVDGARGGSPSRRQEDTWRDALRTFDRASGYPRRWRRQHGSQPRPRCVVGVVGLATGRAAGFEHVYDDTCRLRHVHSRALGGSRRCSRQIVISALRPTRTGAFRFVFDNNGTSEDVRSAVSSMECARPNVGALGVRPTTDLDEESDHLDDAVRAFLVLALVDTGREREAAALALVGRFAWDSASARGPGGARRRRPRADGRP